MFLFGFLFSLAVMSCLSWLIAAYETANWLPWLHEPRLSQDKLFEIFRNAVTVGAALGVGITLFFSYRRQRTTEATQRITAEAQRTAAEAQKTAAAALELSTKQHELERERRQDAVVSELRSRYSVAAEQLSAEAFTVKIAGVFALATLADDWDRQQSPADRQTCIDLLLETYRALSLEGGGGAVTSAIWRSVMDRFRMHNRLGQRWAGGYVNFNGTSPESMLVALRIDGSIDLSQTHSVGAPFVVQSVVLARGGVLNFNGASHSGLEFRSCVFESGRLDLQELHVEQRIVFQQCSFNGTYVVLDDAARGKNIEFIGCSFTAFPNPIRNLTMRKLKFIDCEISTRVMADSEDPTEGIYRLMRRSVYPFDLIVRGSRFENGAPEIEPVSSPGDPYFPERMRSQHLQEGGKPESDDVPSR
ncbi:hypothetical protein AB4Y72_15000 [Arthrobacter sp. YAF34]|uniref:hypothetical protein n=1 Tax=Arthrobacter sp. YAF34 TaxID=3233083 RepID=UPI003F90E085